MQEAIPHYIAAARLDHDNTDAHNGLGVCYAMLGKMDAAAKQFAEILRVQPNEPGAHMNLANALAAQKKIDEADPALHGRDQKQSQRFAGPFQSRALDDPSRPQSRRNCRIPESNQPQSQQLRRQARPRRASATVVSQLFSMQSGPVSSLMVTSR